MTTNFNFFHSTSQNIFHARLWRKIYHLASCLTKSIYIASNTGHTIIGSLCNMIRWSRHWCDMAWDTQTALSNCVYRLYIYMLIMGLHSSNNNKKYGGIADRYQLLQLYRCHEGFWDMCSTLFAAPPYMHDPSAIFCVIDILHRSYFSSRLRST